MNLYSLSTEKLGDFYVVAQSPNDAQSMLKESLDKSNYSFSDYRKVINIKLLAEQIIEFPAGKLNFSSGRKLLI